MFVPLQLGPITPLPIFAGRVCAGFPSPADDYIEDAVDLTRLVVSHPAATFLWRVQGECMIEAGIFDGDILVVDRSLQPRDEDVVVAVIDGQPSVKRLRRVGGRLQLENENRTFKPFGVGEGAEVSIWGVVKCNLRLFRP